MEFLSKIYVNLDKLYFIKIYKIGIFSAYENVNFSNILKNYTQKF